MFIGSLLCFTKLYNSCELSDTYVVTAVSLLFDLLVAYSGD